MFKFRRFVDMSMFSKSFVAKVGEDGRITIAKEIRDMEKINVNDFVSVKVDRLEMFSSSAHRFYDPSRSSSLGKRQASVTNFRSDTKTSNKTAEPKKRKYTKKEEQKKEPISEKENPGDEF